MDTIRILLADDSQYIRTAYQRILETQSNFHVVGVASDGEEAVQKALELSPDVAVLDIRMPRVNGLEAAHRMIRELPSIRIVMVSGYDDLGYVRELLKDGPQGKAYLLKTSIEDVGELIRAVESVFKGGTVLDPNLVQKMVRVHLEHSNSELHQLTDNEREMLELMAGGYEDQDISLIANLPLEQVALLTQQVLEKLGESDATGMDQRSQAVVRFINESSSVSYIVDEGT
jgi:DNA-binding NarL/FixJ family response regulator